jgi:nicotinamidase-related amidase
MPLSSLDPAVALLVIDVQHGVVDRPLAHDAGAVVANAAALANAFRAHGQPVVLVTVAGGAPGRTDAAATRPTRSAAGLPADFSEVVPQLGPGEGDIQIAKHRWGAFTGTSLHDDLQSRAVTQVVLAGISTSIGVESTARAAHELGYHVVLATDAMTDSDSGAHDHSVSSIFPKLGEVAQTSDILTALDH